MASPGANAQSLINNAIKLVEQLKSAEKDEAMLDGMIDKLRKAKSVLVVAQVYCNLGIMLYNLKKFTPALKILSNAATLFTRFNKPDKAGQCTLIRGKCLMGQAKLYSAKSLTATISKLQEAVDVLRQVDTGDNSELDAEQLAARHRLQRQAESEIAVALTRRGLCERELWERHLLARRKTDKKTKEKEKEPEEGQESSGGFARCLWLAVEQWSLVCKLLQLAGDSDKEKTAGQQEVADVWLTAIADLFHIHGLLPQQLAALHLIQDIHHSPSQSGKAKTKAEKSPVASSSAELAALCRVATCYSALGYTHVASRYFELALCQTSSALGSKVQKENKPPANAAQENCKELSDVAQLQNAAVPLLYASLLATASSSSSEAPALCQQSALPALLAQLTTLQAQLAQRDSDAKVSREELMVEAQCLLSLARLGLCSALPQPELALQQARAALSKYMALLRALDAREEAPGGKHGEAVMDFLKKALQSGSTLRHNSFWTVALGVLEALELLGIVCELQGLVREAEHYWSLGLECAQRALAPQHSQRFMCYLAQLATRRQQLDKSRSLLADAQEERRTAQVQYEQLDRLGAPGDGPDAASRLTSGPAVRAKEGGQLALAQTELVRKLLQAQLCARQDNRPEAESLFGSVREDLLSLRAASRLCLAEDICSPLVRAVLPCRPRDGEAHLSPHDMAEVAGLESQLHSVLAQLASQQVAAGQEARPDSAVWEQLEKGVQLSRLSADKLQRARALLHLAQAHMRKLSQALLNALWQGDGSLPRVCTGACTGVSGPHALAAQVEALQQARETLQEALQHCNALDQPLLTSQICTELAVLYGRADPWKTCFLLMVKSLGITARHEVLARARARLNLPLHDGPVASPSALKQQQQLDHKHKHPLRERGKAREKEDEMGSLAAAMEGLSVDSEQSGGGQHSAQDRARWAALLDWFAHRPVAEEEERFRKHVVTALPKDWTEVAIQVDGARQHLLVARLSASVQAANDGQTSHELTDLVPLVFRLPLVNSTKDPSSSFSSFSSSSSAAASSEEVPMLRREQSVPVASRPARPRARGAKQAAATKQSAKAQPRLRRAVSAPVGAQVMCDEEVEGCRTSAESDAKDCAESMEGKQGGQGAKGGGECVNQYWRVQREFGQVMAAAQRTTGESKDILKLSEKKVSGSAKRRWWDEMRRLDEQLGQLLALQESTWLQGWQGGLHGTWRSSALRAALQQSAATLTAQLLQGTEHESGAAAMPSGAAGKKPARGAGRGKKTKAAAATGKGAAGTAQPPIKALWLDLIGTLLQGALPRPAAEGTQGWEGGLLDAATELYGSAHRVCFGCGQSLASEAAARTGLEDWLAEVKAQIQSLRNTWSQHGQPPASTKDAGAGCAWPVAGPLVLCLDRCLQHLPWENLPSLVNQPTTRQPNLLFLAAHLAANGDKGAFFLTTTDLQNAFYILNPGGDLADTQANFETDFKSRPGWRGVVGEAPTEDTFANALQTCAFLVYCGHSAGEQWLKADKLKELDVQAVTLLMGCSSGLLRRDEGGDYEASGMALAYQVAGCPAVVANLWDVTDRDIDRFCTQLLADIVPSSNASNSEKQTKEQPKKAASLSSESLQEVELSAAVGRARLECKLRFINGASPVCYGLPVVFRIR